MTSSSTCTLQTMQLPIQQNATAAATSVPRTWRLIRALIADNPTCTRADLSRLTCQALHWYKADGGLKEMSCRVAMLRMQDDGVIQLPAPTGRTPDRVESRSRRRRRRKW